MEQICLVSTVTSASRNINVLEHLSVPLECGFQRGSEVPFDMTWDFLAMSASSSTTGESGPHSSRPSTTTSGLCVLTRLEFSLVYTSDLSHARWSNGRVYRVRYFARLVIKSANIPVPWALSTNHGNMLVLLRTAVVFHTGLTSKAERINAVIIISCCF